MMYSEFIQGTQCKDTPHNYEVFQNLEVMYMNTNMTKAEIYEYGKKLVDNSPTEQELRIKAMVAEGIAEYDMLISDCEKRIEHYDWLIKLYDADSAEDKAERTHYRKLRAETRKELTDVKRQKRAYINFMSA